MNKFKIKSKYMPRGDQPNAILKLVDGIDMGLKDQVLLGVTGSGKTFTMANIIEKTNRPALVIAHNKTLAAQLANELKEYFPNNAVEFFVSYYDYYQPEAYISSTDTYIEKDSSINDEIDKLRYSTVASLIERKDVIVVASVSCIYGLGNPKEYKDLQISLRVGMTLKREDLISRLIDNQFERVEDYKRSSFRVRGDVVEIFPSYTDKISYKIEFFDNNIENISESEVVSGRKINQLKHVSIFPASHYVVGSDKLKKVLGQIKADAEKEVNNFINKGKLIEAQRLKERTFYDIEMMQEMGFCSGIENYSRYFDERNKGEPPYTLIDFFPKDFLVFIDESHITLPQIRAMHNGDRARKDNLVNYGFRLSSSYDNRPLNFEEFNQRIGQTIYVSATPSNYEIDKADQVVEQIIRPTGLVDPPVYVRPIKGQVDDLIGKIHSSVKAGGRVLVTTLTKKMSEKLSEYLAEHSIKVKYLHSEIDTFERVEIINGLRRQDFDVVVGVNLLREGLDIPEIKLVAILDADKEGFLRSQTSLIQTIGRAARNSESKVVMYADNITKSMKKAIDETNRRRILQKKFNKENNIVPKTIIKDIRDSIKISVDISQSDAKLSIKEIDNKIDQLKILIDIYSRDLEFEKAIEVRDEISLLKRIRKTKLKTNKTGSNNA